jgi:hypothetical protein
MAMVAVVSVVASELCEVVFVVGESWTVHGELFHTAGRLRYFETRCFHNHISNLLEALACVTLHDWKY